MNAYPFVFLLENATSVCGLLSLQAYNMQGAWVTVVVEYTSGGTCLKAYLVKENRYLRSMQIRVLGVGLQ